MDWKSLVKESKNILEIIMKKILLIISALLLSTLVFAQAAAPAPTAAPSNQTPTKFSPGSVLPIELSKTVDAKKVRTGDPVQAKIPHDLSSNGRVVIPQDAKVLGHVAEVKPSDHDSKDSRLGIVFDKIALKDGSEIPLTAEIQAVKSPVSNTAYMAESAPPPQDNPTGSNQTSQMGTPNNSTAPAGQQQAPGAPQTAPADPPLTANTQGVVGIKGYSLSQGTMQDSVISSQEHNVKLESGTQILLKTK
jgi:hypothetical protein